VRDEVTAQYRLHHHQLVCGSGGEYFSEEEREQLPVSSFR
jgi:hypothetical protein